LKAAACKYSGIGHYSSTEVAVVENVDTACACVG